jgi:phage terminase large subunit
MSQVDFELGELKITFNPSQQEFFAKAEGSARYLGFGGGFGNGKTLAGCIQALKMAAMYKDNLVLVGRLKGSDLGASTKKTMLELLAPFLETKQAEYKVKDDKIVLENGSEIVFRHLEDVFSSGILGMNLGYFYIDQAEEVTEEVFNTLKSRLRRRSYAEDGSEAPRGGVMTFNMAGHNWIWRVFKKKWKADKSPLENPESFGLVEASTMDNAAHLPQDYIDDLLANGKEWVDRYVYGSWDAFSGQIFEDFDQETHVIPHREPVAGSIIFAGIDPGFVDPFTVIWLAIEPTGTRYIFMEHYVPGQTTDWHADVLKAKEHNLPVRARYTDAANAQVIHDLNSKGVYCVPAKKETLQSSKDLVGGGIQEIKNLLRKDPTTGKPGIIISDQCVNLIYELQQYAWKPRKGDMNAPEIPEGKHDHTIDCLRYILINYYDTRKTATGKRSSMASARDILVSS